MEKIYDVVILGSGPGGIQAAIHASRKKASVLMMGRPSKSSLYWAHVENFCCHFNVTGEEMLNTGRKQAESFGTEFLEEDALETVKKSGHLILTPESGDTIKARSLIIATGTSRNKLGVPGEKDLVGKGVSYCVDCDGGFFKNETIAMVGCRSAAAHGALTMTKIAGKVHLICDKLEIADNLRAQLDTEGVVMHHTNVTDILGAGKVEGVILEDGTELDVTGVFIELGAKGVLELAATLGLELDDSMKYIATDKKQRTNVPGIYAAGDVCGPPLQMAKAVGEGCVAGIEAAVYAKKLKDAQK